MKFLTQNKLLKILSLNSISVIVRFLLGIISTKIVAVFMGSQGMALLGSFRNFSSMFKSMATLGINNLIVKLVVENKNKNKELSIIYSTFFWVFLIISVFLGSIVLIFSEFISNFLFFSSEYIVAIQFFALLLPLMVLNVFWIAVYNGLEAFKRIIFIQIISNIFVFGLTAVLIWKQKIYGGLISVALSELILIFVTFMFVRKDKSFFQFDLQKIISKKYFNVILKFSSMALLSAVIVPLTLILIRKSIVNRYSIEEAGIWDGVNKLSSFYMLIFSSGLSMYYMPKIASLKTDYEFKEELMSYFKVFIPLSVVVLFVVFMFKSTIISLAFTSVFSKINDVLIWQLLGDLLRIMTLAFGYQIAVKGKVWEYFIIEILFNLVYLSLTCYLIQFFSVEGALMAYFYANLLLLILILWMFRRIFFISA